MKENNQIELESLITDEQQLKNLNDFMQMSFVYESAMGIMRTKLDVLQKEYSLAHGYNPIHTIESRLKKPLSIVNKLRRKNLEISIDAVRRNLKDVAGMRIICNYKNDVYTIVEVLKRQLDVSVVEEKDYIKSPERKTGTGAIISSLPCPCISPTARKRCPSRYRYAPSPWISGRASNTNCAIKRTERCLSICRKG